MLACLTQCDVSSVANLAYNSSTGSEVSFILSYILAYVVYHFTAAFTGLISRRAVKFLPLTDDPCANRVSVVPFSRGRDASQRRKSRLLKRADSTGL